jgi:RNA polymerase sigma-70 factor (sigma-E family)
MPIRTGTDTDPPAAPAPPAAAAVTSFDQLYRERYAGFVRLAYLMVGDNAVAEELVQDAFARAHLRWARIEHPVAYVHTAVLNGARNELRRRARRRRPDPRPEAHTDEATVEVLDALSVLSPRQRAAVVLRFYEGRTEAEIADLLGVRPGTVKSLLHRAMHHLREVIEK